MFSKPRFNVVYLEEAARFLSSLPSKVRIKIEVNVFKSSIVLDKTLFKKIADPDIWEFRTQLGGISYRLFAFWDTENDSLVIATHGIVKKTQKTPSKEINKAIAIRKEYFNNK